ncbi:MAG: hypothetical protein IPN44_07300 [Flavobacteriales bacterium]|nr:hypothetical protein [Flavobacteriales bacterium]
MPYLVLKEAVMRKAFLLVLVLQYGLLSAQNWVLLNPDYKYNYSDDGTDTISNQIFVTHIDTLGVDSFRYEMNRIAVVCDTCPASLGGPCDGCFVRVDQPQFLGYDCTRSGSNWHFNGPDTLLINNSGSIGSTWVFDASTGITASVDAEWSATLFNVTDTLRRILLSNGDTLLLSRSYGILRFENGGEHYDLLGVEGANVGRLFPDPLAYFDYQPGDQLTYHVSSIWLADPPGWFTFPFQVSRYWQVVINGRTETADTIDYTTSVALTNYNSPYPGLMDEQPNWPMPLTHWSFNRTDVHSQHPILSAYPGQVMDTSICWPEGPPNGTRYLAHYGIAADGHARMFSQALGQSFGVPNSGFDASQEVAPGVFPFATQIAINVWYEEGVGIRNVQFRTPYPFDVRVELVGAIIGGDTIIPPPVINWTTSITESSISMFSVFPNPTADQITVIGSGRKHHSYPEHRRPLDTKYQAGLEE